MNKDNLLELGKQLAHDWAQGKSKTTFEAKLDAYIKAVRDELREAKPQDVSKETK